MNKRDKARIMLDARYAHWDECPHCYSFAPFQTLSTYRKITKRGDRNGTLSEHNKECGNCQRIIVKSDWKPTPQTNFFALLK